MGKDIYKILRGRYPENGYVLMEEVSDKAGMDRSRSADYISMSIWPSRGLSLQGFELKSFRNDWLNELKNPKKAENIFQYCDYFWLLTADESIAKIEEIPETWGWLCIKGERIFVKKEAPKLEPKPISRSFLACMLKRAGDKTGFIRKTEIENKISDAKEQGRAEVPREAQQIKAKYDELKKIIEDYKMASGIDLTEALTWRATAKEIGAAVKFIEDVGIDSIKKQLLGLEITAKNILQKISTGLSSLPEEIKQNETSETIA